MDKENFQEPQKIEDKERIDVEDLVLITKFHNSMTSGHELVFFSQKSQSSIVINKNQLNHELCRLQALKSGLQKKLTG